MDKAKKIIFGAVLLVLLASCSQVFEAGISGKVVTASGTSSVGVADVSVFAYTDKGRRDSDFTAFEAGTRTRPGEGSGYVATTNTNANGEFTVNKIVWETKNSEFGKTADVNKLYLIFYHEDYKPVKSDATIISGSTNADNVYVELEGNKDYTAITVNILDVASGDPMTSPCTLEYGITGSGAKDTVTATGRAGINISFAKGSTVSVSFFLSSPGTGWEMCDSTGALLEDGYPEPCVKAGTHTVTLYMKNPEIVLPAFSGDIDGSFDDENVNANDNLPIRLAYRTNEDEADPEATIWKYFAEVDEAQLKTYVNPREVGNNVFFEHGLFSGVGNSDSYTITINESSYPDMGIIVHDENGDPQVMSWNDPTGKTTTIRLRFYFGNHYKDIDYSQRTSAVLGHITVTP